MDLDHPDFYLLFNWLTKMSKNSLISRENSCRMEQSFRRKASSEVLVRARKKHGLGPRKSFNSLREVFEDWPKKENVAPQGWPSILA